MRGMNNISITGTVVKQNLRPLPTQQGQDTLYALDITVAQQVTDSNGRASTNYLPCAYVNKGLDKLAQRLPLGTPVSVDGGFRLERWDEKQEDGTVKKASRTVLRMSRLEVLEGTFETTNGNGKSEVAYLTNADNTATLMGNLVGNPELLKTKEGKLYARATVAVNSKFTRNDEVFERVEYVDVTIWDEVKAKAASQMLKGTPVRVSGQASSSGWKTEEGEYRANFGVTARHFYAISLPTRDEQLAESAKEAPAPEKAPAGKRTTRGKKQDPAPAEEPTTDEMPF